MRADRRFRGSQLRQRGLPRVSRRAAPERYGCLERLACCPTRRTSHCASRASSSNPRSGIERHVGRGRSRRGGTSRRGWLPAIVCGALVARNQVRAGYGRGNGLGLMVIVTPRVGGICWAAGVAGVVAVRDAAPRVRSLPGVGQGRQAGRVQTARRSDHRCGPRRGAAVAGRGRAGLPPAGLRRAAAGLVPGLAPARPRPGRHRGQGDPGPGPVPGLQGVPRPTAGRVAAPARVRRRDRRGGAAGRR